MTAKAKNRQFELLFSGLSEESENCGNCRHFVQNYVKEMDGPERFTPCYGGTCTYPRVKHRKLDDTCIHFERRTDGRE